MPPSSSPIAGSHRIARAATSSSSIPLTPAGMAVKRLIATRQAGGCCSLTGTSIGYRSRRGMPAVHSQTCSHSAAMSALSLPSSSR